MKSFSLESRSVEDTLAIGRVIGAKILPGTLILLQGELGAGKTVIAKGIGLGLGIDVEITSPTYNLMLRYEGRMVMDHWDLYRIESIDDDQEFIESIYSPSSICVIEWADKFKPPVELTRLLIEINHSTSDKDARILTLTTDEETCASVIEPLMAEREGK